MKRSRFSFGVRGRPTQHRRRREGPSQARRPTCVPPMRLLRRVGHRTTTIHTSNVPRPLVGGNAPLVGCGQDRRGDGLGGQGRTRGAARARYRAGRDGSGGTRKDRAPGARRLGPPGLDRRGIRRQGLPDSAARGGRTSPRHGRGGQCLVRDRFGQRPGAGHRLAPRHRGQRRGVRRRPRRHGRARGDAPPRGERAHPVASRAPCGVYRRGRARFGTGMCGSTVVAGLADAAHLDAMRGQNGISLEDAMRARGFRLSARPDATRPMEEVAAYLELHIEQRSRPERTARRRSAGHGDRPRRAGARPPRRAATP